MNKLDRVVGQLLRAIASFCLAALFILLFSSVIARSFQLASFAWLDEVVRGLFAWMVFMGSAALWRERAHFRVDWLEQVIGQKRAAPLLRAFLAFLSLGFMLAMTWYGWELTARSSAVTPVLNLPTGLFYAAIPISGTLMMIYSLRDLFESIADVKAPFSTMMKEK
ncbi:TRAP transporter small permease [Halomonas sp. YLB-10]|uniref:TRAP transporter small permease n=1 Tax=Halomonas sp. YLB-10 TaxID=2483111 RepID=UPI000F601F97|nr:TRAP transporter small permease [Halomonas sp. YLB-10]RQW72509.1 TRAP transporter small permease [Halomonas sp. YLB-10]